MQTGVHHKYYCGANTKCECSGTTTDIPEHAALSRSDVILYSFNESGSLHYFSSEWSGAGVVCR